MTAIVMTHPIVAFASDVLGFALFPRQAGILAAIYVNKIREAFLRLGRRSGKGRMAAVVAVYEATANAAAHLEAVPDGEQVSIVVVATSQRQARVVHRYIRHFLQAPQLAGYVVRDTVDEIELRNGIVIITVPCHAAAARGGAAAVVILDEAAWFAGRDGSPLDPKEIWDALEPATAQFPEGRVLVLSTPRYASGWFADMCRLADSGRFSEMRHWHATTAEMTPRSLISQARLDQARAMDPVAFRREYEASFESGIGAALDSDLVRDAQRADAAPLPVLPGVAYLMAIDPAFTGDRWSLLIGHREPAGRIVVDVVRAWQGSRSAPIRLDPVLDQLADYAVAYNQAPALTDQYAAEPIRQGLRARGVAVRARAWTNETKIDALAALRRALYAGQLSLPRHRGLITELVDLEQRLLPSGRPRIAGPAGRHDDYASALMALVFAWDVRGRGIRTMGVRDGRIVFDYLPRGAGIAYGGVSAEPVPTSPFPAETSPLGGLR